MKKLLLILALCLLPVSVWAVNPYIAGIVASGGSPAISDNFSSDTTSDYTVLTNSINYDSANQRMGGASSEWANAGACYSTSTGSANHYVQAKIGISSGDKGESELLFRNDGSSESGFLLRVGGTDRLTLDTYPSAWVLSLFFTGDKTWPLGTYHLVKASVSGTTLSAYVDFNDDGDFDDADETLTTSTIIDSTPTGNYIGFFWSQNGEKVYVDDLEADAL